MNHSAPTRGNTDLQIRHSAPKRSPRQSSIRALIDVQRIRATTRAALIGRDIRLAVIERRLGGTGVDDVDRNAVADSADGSATVPAVVTNLEAFAAGCGWALQDLSSRRLGFGRCCEGLLIQDPLWEV